MNPPADKISAIICTRNRGATVEMAVRTVLANTHPDFECVVVDQSTNEETAEAVRPFLSDPRLRYVRSDSKGLGKAHNIGMQETQGSIVAITDDDCEVPTDWLEKLATLFAQEADIGIVFCNVEAAEHDRSAGFIPAYHCQGDKTLRFRPDGKGDTIGGGIGAGMAVRRSCVEAVGGFDDNLGPGALFPSADETDLKVRALLKGYAIRLTEQTQVLHYGFRTWEEGKTLTVRDTLASGAAHSKHFRRGGAKMRWLVLQVVGGLTASIARDSVRARKPQGAKRLTSYLRGFAQGARIPVDPETLLFSKRL